MARPRRHDGAVYPRKGTKALWIKYRDRTGHIIRESANTEDWQEAQKRLRERLQARDERVLEIVRKGKQLLFGEWNEFFLENYSKPPIRAPEDPRG
jgi:hypothetical protein